MSPAMHHEIRRVIRTSAAALSFTLLLPVVVHAQATSSPQQDSARSGKPDLGPMRTIEFDVDEGTWMSLDVSPDGRTIRTRSRSRAAMRSC